MNIVYAHEEMPLGFSKSIFLAGPTPRKDDVKSWRDEALTILDKLNYSGVVFVPEPRDGKWSDNYDKQVEWEQKYRRASDIIVFWVPRDLKTMPAFTTNVEFGEDYDSYKVVYGRPSDAPKNKYLDTLYKQFYKEEPKETLKETLSQAVSKIGEGAFRVMGERSVPLYIYKSKQFSAWLAEQKNVGNRLADAKVNTSFCIKGNVFSYQLWVKVWIKAENRFKENEFIISRTDISTVATLYKDKDDIKVILVKEFRSPVRNDEGYVYELPGGSSFKPTEDILKVAADEVSEETNLKVEPSQIKHIISRQLAATWSTHKSHLFVCWLTKEQFNQALKSSKSKEVFGNEEDTERTYIEIYSLNDLFKKNLVDWSTLGMLYQAIQEGS
jgi:ADP-ribose pyrophosphatase YjhB (NUDIX family)